MSTGYFEDGYLALWGIVNDLKRRYAPDWLIVAHVRCTWNHAERYGVAETERCHKECNPEGLPLEYLAATWTAGMVEACQNYIAGELKSPSEMTRDEVLKRLADMLNVHTGA